MKEFISFFELIVNTLTEHIVVIDNLGDIKFVNQSWIEFATNNEYDVDIKSWYTQNYLDVCKNSKKEGNEYAKKAYDGIKKVISKKKDIFYFEYPCHSVSEKRWFMMRVIPFIFENKEFYVISHQNITERVLAELKVEKLSMIDPLTSISNRRHFNNIFDLEYKRCQRENKYLCVAMIDIDYFKLLNDRYGHQEGDNCLKKVAAVLKNNTKRASDFSARYGGEEFILIVSNSSSEDFLKLLKKIKNDIAKLKIENIDSPIDKYLTVSIGATAQIPNKTNSKESIIKKADDNLYKIKESGRDKIFIN